MNAPAKGSALAALNVNIPSLSMDEGELLRVLESSIYPGAKTESMKLVIGYCKANVLDPMTKPVHIVPMNVKKPGTRDQYEWRDVIMPGIELYRTKAARTGEYAGIDDADFGPDVSADESGEVGISYPLWCRVTVYRIVDGQPRAFSSGKVFWKETYATAARDSAKPNAMWRKRPYGQIEKCAEAMALRRAFPEIGAEPTAEEMVGKTIEADPIDGTATRAVEMPRAITDTRGATTETGGATPANAGENIDRGTGEITGNASETDKTPMTGGQKKILKAKLANASLTDADLKAKFDRGLDDDGWLFSDFALVQDFIKERSAATA